MLSFTELRTSQVSQQISKNDKMYSSESPPHYFYVGRSNLWTILNIVNIRKSYHRGDTEIRRILDFGCGHGRVTRYIRAAFPSAGIFVTDYDPDGVKFCVDNFACIDAGRDIPEWEFDLVFLGSVFTHLPAHITEPLLERLLNSLNTNGVLVFTTQGRYSIERMKNFDWDNDKTRPWLRYNLDKSSFFEVVSGYEASGYGYVDYPGQKDYGVCIARGKWYSRIASRRNDIIQILFQEKGSDNHQDVSAYMRAGLVDHSKGPLW